MRKEVEYWLEHKSPDRLFIGLTDGELAWDGKKGDFKWPTKAPLPKALKRRFAAEPRWVDLRAYRDGADARNAKLIELGADFAAAIHGMPKEDLLSQEVRQQRRALMLAWSAAGTLLVLLGLALWLGYEANVQRGIAVAQRDRAERTLTAATNTAHSLVFDLAQRFRYVSNVPASLVRDILDQALKLQDQLSSAGELNLDLSRIRSVSLNETVTTLLSIGDTAGALDAANKSLAIIRDLVRQQPDNTLWQSDLVTDLIALGDVKLQAGDQAGALAAFDEKSPIARALAADKNDANAQQRLLGNLERIGDVKLQEGDLAGVIAVYDESLVAARSARRPQTSRRPSAISRRHCSPLALPSSTQATLQAPLPLSKKSLAIRRELAKDQSNAQAHRDITVILNALAKVRLQRGDQQGALAAYRESLGIGRELAKDKSNAEAQRDLSVSLIEIGDVLLRKGEMADALASFEEGLALRRELAEKDKQSTLAQDDVAAVLVRIGNVKLSQNDVPAALQAYDESLAIRRPLAADKRNADAQRELATTLLGMVDVKLHARDQGGVTCRDRGMRRRLPRARSRQVQQRRPALSGFGAAEVGRRQVSWKRRCRRLDRHGGRSCDFAHPCQGSEQCRGTAGCLHCPRMDR